MHIGTATADITPNLPVALDGQFNMRIAPTAATPLTANVVALESRDGIRSLDLAIMVSCDVLWVPADLIAMVRSEVHQRLPFTGCNQDFPKRHSYTHGAGHGK